MGHLRVLGPPSPGDLENFRGGQKIEKIKIPQQVLHETKVIYRESPKPKKAPIFTKKITKSGTLEILVDDMESGRELAKEQIEKYDGSIKSEQVYENENKRI